MKKFIAFIGERVGRWAYILPALHFSCYLLVQSPLPGGGSVNE